MEQKGRIWMARADWASWMGGHRQHQQGKQDRRPRGTGGKERDLEAGIEGRIEGQGEAARHNR
eukprot:scaffold235108_cov23-Tisochrysis_lutea.AAC.1